MANVTITRPTGGYYPPASIAANYINIIHRNFLPDLIEQALRMKPLFLYLMLRDCMVQNTGGFSPITQPVLTTEFGAQVFPMQFDGSGQMSPMNNPIINAEWPMAGYGIFIPSSVVEVSMIQGAGKGHVEIDVIKARLSDFMAKLIDTVDSQILGSAGGDDTKMSGLADAIDNGTGTQIYGNIDRSTNPKWGAIKFNDDGSNTTTTWTLISSYLSSYQNVVDDELPNVIFCSMAAFEQLCKTLLTSASGAVVQQMMVQNVDDLNLTRSFGVKALILNGIPIFPITKLGSAYNQVVYFVNGRRFQMHINPDFFFSLSEPASLLPVGTHGWVNALEFAGNLICTKPISNFKVTNFPVATLATPAAYGA